jgi:hypothetical protein
VGRPPLCDTASGEADIEVRQVVTSSTLPPPLREPQPGEKNQVVAYPLVTGGWLVLDPREHTATFRVPDPIDPQELVHPYLVPAAAGFCEWAGREAYHAGSFVVGGRAWAVVGEKEGGKSTLLASLAQRGLGVLSDDLLVLDERRVLHGPRLIDLREPAAVHMDLGEPLRSAREGGRWRMRLGRTPDADLAGWIFLRWGDAVELNKVGLADRIDRLLELVPTRAETVVSLAALPAYELVRPPSWEALPGALDALLDALGGGVGPG